MEDAGLGGPDWSRPLPSDSGCRAPAAVPPVAGRARTQPASPPSVFAQSLALRAGQAEGSLFFCSLVIPQFGLLSHVSCLRLSSGHAGPVLTLSTDYPARTSLSRPCLLMADFSIWATSLLAVAIRHIICVFFVSVFLPVMLPSEVPKLPTDPPVTGFPTVCKLLLLHSFLPRTGCLCP